MECLCQALVSSAWHRYIERIKVTCNYERGDLKGVEPTN